MNDRFLSLMFLLLAATARAEIKVVVERNVKEAMNAEFTFPTISPLSDADAGQDATIEILDGKPGWGSDAKQLIDGVGPTTANEMLRMFCFGQNTDTGRIRMDLGAVKPVSRINTYSWNNGNRAPQVYRLYASDGTAPNFVITPPREADPTRAGWVKIATIDTRPADFMKKDGGGGQYAVGITDDRGAIGRFRYLLWDIQAATNQPGTSTTYAEFDVEVADALPPSRLAKIKMTDGRMLEGSAYFKGDSLVVTQEDSEQSIKLSELSSAEFHEALPPTELPTDSLSAGGLKAEYFDDQEFRKPRLVRYDPTLNFQWGLGAPDPSVNVDFAARWTGRIEPKYTETYTFQTHAEDGVRLWIDGRQIIDRWEDAPPYLQEAKIALQAGRKYDIRIDYHNKMGEAILRLRWSSPSQRKEIVAASQLSPPVNDPAFPPRVMLTAPIADRWRIAPGSMDLEATASAPKGSIARVEFFSTNTLLGTVTTPPYRYTWVHVPPGHHKLTARATDEAGTITASLPVMVNVAANGSGSLPPPWGSMRLGAMERRDSSSYSGGLFTIRAGGGELRGAFDSGYFIAQPLDGDGQITVRVGDISAETTPNAITGVMFRESLSGDARYSALMAGKNATEYLCRREPASWVAANDISRTAPCYLRLVRLGKFFKAYVSDNGTSWQLVGSDQLNLGSQTFVGLMTTSRADDELCTATVDHVQVQAGSPPMEATTAGVQTRGGSFLAGEIQRADESQVLLRRKRGESLTVMAGDVARIFLRPVPLELSAGIGRGHSGVLLASGDFYEGDFRGIKGGRVMVDSVVFGLKTFENRELLAIALHDVSDDGKHLAVRTGDGSVYVPANVTIDAGRLQMKDDTAGSLSVSIRDVVEIRR